MRAVVVALVVAALVGAPAASAKLLKNIVAVAAGGASVEVEGLDWGALRTAPAPAPTGGYLLLYPLAEQGLAAQPGRYFPDAGVACYSWDRSALGSCWRVAEELAARLGGLPPLVGAPTILAGLTISGRPGRLTSNGAVAIELAFARPSRARTAKTRPLNCLALRATWTGADATLRPARFWSCPAGLWARGRIYPVGSLAGI